MDCSLASVYWMYVTAVLRNFIVSKMFYLFDRGGPQGLVSEWIAGEKRYSISHWALYIRSNEAAVTN
jgi:hypothetical protein